MSDQVTSPAHYAAGGMEPIDYMKLKLTPEQFEGFLIGNVMKYLSRAKHKNGVEDYKKAAFYARFLAGDDPRKNPSDQNNAPQPLPSEGTYTSAELLLPLIAWAESHGQTVITKVNDLPNGPITIADIDGPGHYRVVPSASAPAYEQHGWAAIHLFRK